MPKREDLTNKIFGLIKCISPAPSKSGKTYWNCECIKCGETKIIQTSHLKSGAIRSCGCGCLEKDDIKIVKKCPICGKDFIIINTNGRSRKYCYECSPSYDDPQKRAASINCLRRKMKEQAIKIKGGKCEKCGYDKCIGALQFHHIDPQNKKFGLSQNGNLHSWEEYLKEANKCILLCANCHAEEHDRLFREGYSQFDSDN